MQLAFEALDEQEAGVIDFLEFINTVDPSKGASTAEPEPERSGSRGDGGIEPEGMGLGCHIRPDTP